MPKGKPIQTGHEGEPWTVEDVNELLNRRLEGEAWKPIMESLGRSFKSVKTAIWKAITEYENSANFKTYIPKGRIDRTGKRWTKYDQELWRWMLLREGKGDKVSWVVRAMMLGRSVEDLRRIKDPKRRGRGFNLL